MVIKLIVKKAVREHLKSVDDNKRCSDGFLEALDQKVEETINKAIVRANGNRRATLREIDV